VFRVYTREEWEALSQLDQSRAWLDLLAEWDRVLTKSLYETVVVKDFFDAQDQLLQLVAIRNVPQNVQAAGERFIDKSLEEICS